ncbi:MAG: hypothetical protein ACK501_11915 [Planctomycetota bacterium]|jgi:hypothetical protein
MKASTFALPWLALLAALPAQQLADVAYPERDILSPFRTPKDVYAPPDELFRLLRLMQSRADSGKYAKSYDHTGREMVDDDVWRDAFRQVFTLGLDAGYLAQIIRLQAHAPDRMTAFYAGFYVTNPGNAIELIEHIAGEPDRNIRQAMFPRAVEYLRKNLGRRFGDLTSDQKIELQKSMPIVGSPEAKARGITRAPHDSDALHGMRVVPFLQLLDVDDPIDQAQAAWFLNEVFQIRMDLALAWLEPSLPRLHQLLDSPSKQVREQVITLLTTIGPKDLRRAPTDARDLHAWANEAARGLFAPIRNINDAIVQIHPSPERDALVAAALEALENSSIGDPFVGQGADGQWIRGFRVATVPDELKPLAIPAEAIITTINGSATPNAKVLIDTVRTQYEKMKRGPRRFLVEYVLKGKTHAVEFRVM